jgi:hypothetical protein
MHTKHGDDHLAYLKYNLELLLEVGATEWPNRNWVYSISMTTIRDMRMDSSVSTIDTSQSNPS